MNKKARAQLIKKLRAELTTNELVKFGLELFEDTDANAINCYGEQLIQTGFKKVAKGYRELDFQDWTEEKKETKEIDAWGKPSKRRS
jgi:hypothetical protein